MKRTKAVGKVTFFLLLLSLVSACTLADETIEEEPSVELLPIEEVQEVQSSIRLMFIGDNMMAGNVARRMDEEGNAYPLTEVLPILKEADLVIANLETAIGTSGKLAEKEFAFQSSPARLELFEPLREQLVWIMANNHAMDAPLHESMEHLDRLGYTYIGVGENQEQAFQPFVQEIKGISIAVVAASRVIPFTSWTAGEHSPGMASAYADEPLLSVVSEWSGKVDYLIVYMHWGEELAEQPNAVQLAWEEKLREAGADIIVGSHPHVVQGLRWEGDKQLTAYSLGNFVFTTSYTATANDTLILDLQLTSEKIEGVQIWPVQIQYGLLRNLESLEEQGRIFQRVQRLSPALQVGEDGRITNIGR